MTVSRRTFMTGLVSFFGVASSDALTKKIQDRGTPLLLVPKSIEKTLRVFEGGTVFYSEDGYGNKRPTWREVLLEEGWPVNDPDQISRILSERYMETEDELDQQVSDVCWPMVHGVTWSPMARAVRLLERLKVGPKLTSKNRGVGQLNFHYGDNHPGSNDIWVEVEDDLSVSLLQARIIELNQPIKIVMEVPTILKYE
jgi:hypothetical protein